MLRFLLYTACFILSCAAAYAQAIPGTNVQQYTTDNGLPSNGIKGLQWDEKTEFLWMSTEAGIVRFNGVDFKSFTKENMPEIGSERMLFIVRNNSGSIYTSDQPGNVFLIDKSRPVLWKNAAPATSNTNPQLGQYYLLSVSDIFFKSQVAKPMPRRFTSGNNRVAVINDTSCFIQNGSMLYYFSVAQDTPVALPVLANNLLTLFMIKDRFFIMNLQRELFLLDPVTRTIAPVPGTGSGIALLKKTNKGTMLSWQTGMDYPIFIEEEKAWQILYDGRSINATPISNNIPTDAFIKSVQYSEKNNLLFIGTESRGLFVISRNRVQSKKRSRANPKNRNSYYSQVALPDGNILTNESDVIGDRPTDERMLPIKGKFNFNVSLTSGGSLWYSQNNARVGHNCLYEYNYTTGVTKTYPTITNSNIVTELGGRIYMADLYGIGLLDADTLRYLYRYPKELAGTVTFDFTPLNNEELAVATCAGLLRYHIRKQRLDTIFSQENICVRSIWKYKDYVFFGTYGGGFYIYRNGSFRRMPLDKNKYLLYPHCFVPDAENYCWISTNRGLFKASLPELIDAYQNNRPSVYYHYFGKKDGMEMTELNGGCTPCALRLNDNTISFPTMDGLLWVKPETAKPVLPTGDVFIDEIRVNGEKINSDSLRHKKLSPQTQDMVIQLGFPAWCNKENIYIDYQLNDTVNWKPVNTGSEAVIRLSNLGPGRYLLRIRKLNGFGINNYNYKTIEFRISTPWHNQWWFYALCMLGLLGITQLIFHIRTRQYKIRQHKLEMQVAEKTRELKEQNEVLEKNDSIKTRLISIISHDIVTPLKFVTVAGKNLLDKRSMMPEDLQLETIREMTNTAQELQLLSTNILNWIKYQNENRRLVKEPFNLHESVNQVMGILNSLAKQKNLVLENRVPDALQIYQYFEPLKILVYNLLTNAINFSEKGSIRVLAEQRGDQVILCVQDEGVGMTADQIKNIMADQFIISSANIDNRKGNGLGYLIIKDLVKLMGATLHIESEKNKGTQIFIHLPSLKPSRSEP
ncbi:MAG TPA: ATP-binding protein [Ferruginibacter sp.]|nr:ATP-binding protein [Ferruginibacter sp.]